MRHQLNFLYVEYSGNKHDFHTEDYYIDPKYFETPDSNREKLLLITAAYVQGIRLIDNMEVIQ